MIDIKSIVYNKLNENNKFYKTTYKDVKVDPPGHPHKEFLDKAHEVFADKSHLSDADKKFSMSPTGHSIVRQTVSSRKPGFVKSHLSHAAVEHAGRVANAGPDGKSVEKQRDNDKVNSVIKLAKGHGFKQNGERTHEFVRPETKALLRVHHHSYDSPGAPVDRYGSFTLHTPHDTIKK